jgi:hypothetical protein
MGGFDRVGVRIDSHNIPVKLYNNENKLSFRNIYFTTTPTDTSLPSFRNSFPSSEKVKSLSMKTGGHYRGFIPSPLRDAALEAQPARPGRRQHPEHLQQHRRRRRRSALRHKMGDELQRCHARGRGSDGGSAVAEEAKNAVVEESHHCADDHLT